MNIVSSSTIAASLQRYTVLRSFCFITYRLLVTWSVVAVAVLMSALTSCSSPQSADEIISYDIDLSGERQVPSLMNTGTGKFTATYNRTTKVLDYTLTWNLTNNAVATRAHLHGPASERENADIQVVFFNASTNMTSGTFRGTVTLTSAQETDMLAGRYYCNIHSNLNPPGALRGQVVRR